MKLYEKSEGYTKVIQVRNDSSPKGVSVTFSCCTLENCGTYSSETHQVYQDPYICFQYSKKKNSKLYNEICKTIEKSKDTLFGVDFTNYNKLDILIYELLTKPENIHHRPIIKDK